MAEGLIGGQVAENADGETAAKLSLTGTSRSSKGLIAAGRLKTVNPD